MIENTLYNDGFCSGGSGCWIYTRVLSYCWPTSQEFRWRVQKLGLSYFLFQYSLPPRTVIGICRILSPLSKHQSRGCFIYTERESTLYKVYWTRARKAGQKYPLINGIWRTGSTNLTVAQWARNNPATLAAKRDIQFFTSLTITTARENN
jgi:hypothetical protein